MQEKIRKIALMLLAQRDYSHEEMLQKLKNKSFDLADIESVLNNLATSGLVNDARYTTNFVEQKRDKGYGPQRICRELKAKGISSDVIEEMLTTDDNAWFVAMRKLWLKRFKGQSPGNYKERAKQIRFLQYRGYTLEQIGKLFDTENEYDETK